MIRVTFVLFDLSSCVCLCLWCPYKLRPKNIFSFKTVTKVFFVTKFNDFTKTSSPNPKRPKMDSSGLGEGAHPQAKMDSDDPATITKVVEELVSQGYLDQIRKECLAEVDTKVHFRTFCSFLASIDDLSLV